MKRSTRRAPSAARLAALIAAGLALGATQQTLAAGTASNTSISNLATLGYSVGGVTQTSIESSEAGNTTAGVGNGSATSFAVDNKINVTVVTTDAAAVTASPGQVAATPLPNPPAYVSFTVTNTGNTTQDFILSNTNPASGADIPFGVSQTSEFAVSSCRTFVEDGTTAGLQLTEDSESTYLNNIAAEGSATVYLVCNTPITATNNQDAAVGLIAEAVDAAGTSGSPSASYTGAELTAVNTQAGVEIVAADLTGSEAGDSDRDTRFSARSAYVIATTTLSVAKTVTTLCDPFNGLTDPKNIPGAMVRWTITVENTGSVSATLATIGDVLNANTTQDPNLVAPTSAATCSSAAGVAESAAGRGFQIESSVGTRPLGGTAGYMTGAAAGNDGATLSGQNVTIDFATALPAGGAYSAGELKAGETATVTFNVTIN